MDFNRIQNNLYKELQLRKAQNQAKS